MAANPSQLVGAGIIIMVLAVLGFVAWYLVDRARTAREERDMNHAFEQDDYAGKAPAEWEPSERPPWDGLDYSWPEDWAEGGSPVPSGPVPASRVSGPMPKHAKPRYAAGVTSTAELKVAEAGPAFTADDYIRALTARTDRFIRQMQIS